MIIGLSTTNSIFSKIVRWWQGTSYSHTYIELDGKIYHATGKGVHLVQREEFTKKNIIVREYKFNDVDKDLATLICTLHYGKSYGALSLLGIALRHTLGIKLFADDTRTFICSELVGTVLEIVFDVELGDQNYFTPRDIEEKLEWINYKKHLQK